MAENKPKRFTESRGWIQNDPATGTPLPAAPTAEAKGHNIGLGVGLAVGGWALAIIPIMALGAYIRLVNDCLSSGASSCAGSTEGGNIPVVMLIIACMVVGPVFLGFAAATKKGWAWLVTALLALPVIFIGYDLITNAFL
ncbi:hypothetical protein ART_3833 [Arthrobacter sp. PAMC 25486]|uniref:hypothetical protein n=1 Tax=Arthrobacter sp. PAMC 25486 TaxID=1494608 RepID=UPI0005360EC4|nr:hypothetical protein [Arthrobacter sp. PAMC 25486]AIY03432.1 hypothetical protein ART_3833 [Arthrobacter sp. PAMC 25486]